MTKIKMEKTHNFLLHIKFMLFYVSRMYESNYSNLLTCGHIGSRVSSKSCVGGGVLKEKRGKGHLTTRWGC